MDTKAATLRMLTNTVPVSNLDIEWNSYDCTPPSTNSGKITKGGLRIRGQFKRTSELKPLISIVTVVMNGKLHLRNCIESILCQSYDNIEYIIIDGGSRDGTLSIIQEYDDRIDYWVSEPDNGISDAFNKGIHSASGDLIGIVNADDWLELNACSLVSNIFINAPNASVICGKVQYWKNGIRDYVFDSNPSKLQREMTINHPSCFVSSTAYRRFGGFKLNYKYAMDYELMLRFFSKNAAFYSLPDIISNMSLDGVSDRFWHKSLWESRKAKAEILGPSASIYLYWLYQVLRRRIRDVLISLRLSKLVLIHRKHFSILKKHADS